MFRGGRLGWAREASRVLGGSGLEWELKDHWDLDEEEEEEEGGTVRGGAAGVKLWQQEGRLCLWGSDKSCPTGLDALYRTGGASWQSMDHIWSPDVFYLAHSVKQLKISRTLHVSSFSWKMGRPCQLQAWPKWAGSARAPTAPLTPRSLYSLTLFHWSLQTVLFATPGLGKQLEGKAGKTGWGQVHDAKHTSSGISKAWVQILTPSSPSLWAASWISTHLLF